MFAKTSNIHINKKDNNQFELIFDVSWNGSWKNTTNCDGVYVFVKYKYKDEYKSVILSSSSIGEFDYTAKQPDGYLVNDETVGMYVPYTKLGVFLYPLTNCDNKLQDTTVSLLCEGNGEYEDLQLFILEMVYIPEDGHYVGDPENGMSRGGKLKNCFYQYPDKGAYYIDSEEEIKFAPEDGCLYSDMDTPNGRQEETPFTIPKEFPKGYKAMWYMKYSLNCEQYVQFLNCLTRKQQQAHVTSDISKENIEQYYVLSNTNEEFERNTIYCRKKDNFIDRPVKFYTSAPKRVCNILAYKDTAAFACFAGLRLITELEFEKAARGTAKAIPGEFAWGSNNIARVFNFDGIDGSGTEIPLAESDGQIVNCNFAEGIAPFEREFKKVPDNPGFIGPVSTGLFERSEIIDGYTKRECMGASFYGVMELSGNVWENLVTVGREEGRKYNGQCGNGLLDEEGYHTMENWPDSNTAIGMGVRGGVFVSPSPYYVKMALRAFAAHTKAERRYHGGLRVGF